ncbi:dual specificity protein kinase TTK [Asbolus verrucosus]|uniref:Dual specificity protein kinase TTK n=1 Tax=Asbolus verrucosus TaxID=1661398 RepID=A0A482VT65_ASBVE|nr:dual specificity protein kinase TTK [Asbolus verrucosus]
MGSVTGDFTNLTTGQEGLNSRNAVSTVKRKCQRRKILKIAPLRLVEIQKELEEADNEPQWSPAKETEGKNDSFAMGLAVLSLTPSEKPAIKDGNFATPQVAVPQKTNRMLEYDYITPKNKVPPKIQCSVNMQTYLKTPIEKLTADCNRIIKMFDFEINNEAKTLLVVLEVGGADLSKILKESALNTTHMPVYMLVYYWMEMLYAVKQIHSHGIIHSDLKPANFLKVEGYLKLIDFGIASCIQSDMTSVIKVVPEGSFNYISPEALHNESSSNKNSPSAGIPKYKISFKSDVWSLGCILYQLVYRKTPFQHITQMWMKLSTLLDPNHKIDYPDVGWVPPKIINTMKSCLQHNMKLRPSVDELISEYESIFQNL